MPKVAILNVAEIIGKYYDRVIILVIVTFALLFKYEQGLIVFNTRNYINTNVKALYLVKEK